MADMLKSENDGKHPSNHYLVIENPGEVSTWHLRVRGTDGKPDHTLMGAAWAALHGGYRGNKYAGPNKAAALKKLIALYHAENMELPVSSKAFVFKDKSGQSWFIGIYSNNFKDRQQEIVTEEAHREFIAWLKATGIRPPIILIHQPKFPDIVHFVHYLGLINKQITSQEYTANLMQMYRSTAIAQTETVFMLNGFVFVIGKVLKNKEAVVEQLMTNKTQWGMSHGYLKLKGDKDFTERYRSFEFTAVPAVFAANMATSISLSSEGTMDTQLKDLSEADRQLLEQVMGDAQDDLEQATAKAREILSRVLESKAEVPAEETPEMAGTPETVETPVEEPATEEKAEQPVTYSEIRVKLIDDLKIAQLTEVLKNIGDTLDQYKVTIESQATELAELKSKVAKVEKTEDERLAEFITPDWSLGFKHSVPAKTEEELLQQVKAAIPAAVIEKKADEAAKDNPLKIGFYDLINLGS